MQTLDPLTIPLYGSRLIEASAGTGKTYTLALLFLRLLLERQLDVDQILVVTFTRAATGELRDRIRRRLREGIDYLEHRCVCDPQLQTLLERGDRALVLQRLRDALVRMDEAAVLTIHGFCQRVLKEYAFESGSLFDVELLENEDVLRRQIIEDFWRQRFYPATREEAAWAATRWGEPSALLGQMVGATQAVEVDIMPTVTAAQVEHLRQQCVEELVRVRHLWPSARKEVRQILEQDPCLQRNDKAYRLQDCVPEAMTAMDQLAGMTDLPYLLPRGSEKLAQSVLAASLLKKCAEPPSHPFFAVVDAFYQTHVQMVSGNSCHIAQDARRYLLAELERRKERQGQLAFDDLLTRMDRALDGAPSGSLLASRLAERYQAVLVDEFQDTDPVQYRLFQKIYRNRTTATLFVIGDPKQAIYSFRGADIFTYMQARRETPADGRYSMATNHRSTPEMVRAVNTLFGLHEQPFVFSDDIAFHPVEAAGSGASPRLLAGGQSTAPLKAFVLDTAMLVTGRSKSISKENATRAAAQSCAGEVARLLAPARGEELTLDGRPLAAGDIAFLVRTHREAEAMQDALQLRGLSSVYYSQSSVFTTDEAKNLALLMTALTDLAEVPVLKTLLATDLFDLNAEAIHGLQSEEQQWNDILDRLHGYQILWREQGFAPMFQQLLADRRVTRRLTGRPGGDRRLTNYLHLAELLQENPAAQPGMTGLLRWLKQQIHAPDSAGEAQLIRLENDENLIRIVTIHRSKGLEFAVVFLPFLWAARQEKQGGPLTFHDRSTLRLTVDLGTGRQEHQRWAEEERLAEDVRLLYVAVTRAKYRCVFCWGRVNGFERSGLARLFHDGRVPESDQILVGDLNRLNHSYPLLEIAGNGPPGAGSAVGAPVPAVPLQAKLFRGQIRSGWSTTSYSRLTASGPAEERGDDQSPRLPPRPEDFADIFTLPRGPLVGICLHALFERLDFSAPVEQQQPILGMILEEGGIDLRWLPAVTRWIKAVLAVELPGGRCLQGLGQQDRINELSFLFPLEQVNLHALNGLLDGVGLRTLPATADHLQGLMKGFVDLVFRHQGRYFLVDYKSNHLGYDPMQYNRQGMAACMEEHQYHLQSLIYALALHRFLGQRMEEYRYETHFGGVYYLFLRGMHPDYPTGSGVYAALPEAGLIRQLDACCRGGKEG